MDVKDPTLNKEESAFPKPDFDKGFPIVPLRKFVVYPRMGTRLAFDRSISLNALRKIDESHGYICCVLQKNQDKDIPEKDDLHKVGIIAFVKDVSGSPRNLILANIFGFMPVELDTVTLNGSNEFDQYLHANVKPHILSFENKKVAKALSQNLMNAVEQYAHIASNLPDNLEDILKGIPLEEQVIIAHGFLRVSDEEHQQILESKSVEEMCAKIDLAIKTALDVHRIVALNRQQTELKMQRSQREWMLQEQISQLQKELDEITSGSSDSQKFSTSAKDKKLPPAVKEKFDEEMARLKLLNPMNPEYTVVRNYIDWILALPFGIYTEDILDIKKTNESLNSKHFGLEKAKNRILEHIAVLKMARDKKNSEHRSPILCLVGPPGVGKTTLAMSIANSMNRNLARISLGGVHDDAEIRGHRRTYIGSMPGRLIQALRKAKSMNPLILLDEIDKMSRDFRGDPANAILEVLDPELNSEFVDHFMEVGVDLSKVMFIATANTPDSIPPALYDRMEIVRMPGYLRFEKERIAKDFLMPKILRQNSLSAKQFSIADSAIHSILQEYTREAGVRELERKLETIARKRAMEIVSRRKFSPKVTQKQLFEYLGVPDFEGQRIVDTKRPGVTTGLAWTPVGGDILRIECLLLQGRGGKLLLTGHLGDVMKESAQIALSLVRERSKQFKIAEEKFRKMDVHLHFPEGATPKDGPSAGIAITLAMLSAFTGKIISPFTAFTGEVSLTGRLIAIGGLKEKSLAALDGGVKKLFLPIDNKKNVEDLPEQVKQGMEIKMFTHIDEVIKELF